MNGSALAGGGSFPVPDSSSSNWLMPISASRTVNLLAFVDVDFAVVTREVFKRLAAFDDLQDRLPAALPF